MIRCGLRWVTRSSPIGRRSANGPFARRSRVGRPDGGRCVRTAVAVASTGLIAVGGFALVQLAICRPRPALRRFRGASTASRAPAAGGEIAIETVTVTQLSPDTVLAPLPDRDGRGFALRAGGARFSVPHDTRHPFVVVGRGRDHRGPRHDVHRPLSRRRSAEHRRRRGARPRARGRHRHGGSGGRDAGGPGLAARRSPAETAAAGRRGGVIVAAARRAWSIRRGAEGAAEGRVPVPCATTPPICCWPRTPLA